MKLPRVTEILKSQGMIDDRFFTPLGANRGTNVHKLCAFYDQGRENIKEAQEMGLIGYLDAWKKFRDNFSPRYYAEAESEGIEERLESKCYEFCGTPDRVWTVNRQRWILDIKTGTSLPWHKLQLAAYAILANEKTPGYYRRAGVYLSKTGKFSMKEFKDDIKDREQFLFLLNDYKNGER